MPSNKLTDARIRALKPLRGPQKVADGDGMYLFVSPRGAKAWRLSWRVDGRQQQMSLGAWPEVGLADARRRREAARAKIAAGQDPRAKRVRASVTLSHAIELYWAGRRDVGARYVLGAQRCMATYIEPRLGARAPRSLARHDVLDALMVMDTIGLASYVRKARMWLSLVLDWCVEHGHADTNVAADIRPERAFARVRVKHFAAVEVQDAHALWARISLEEEMSGPLTSILACRWLAYTWVRTNEMRFLPLQGELDLEHALWRIPAARMKMDRDHLVPLPRQAVSLARLMQARARGSNLLFAADHRQDRPVSENTVLALLARLGYKGKMTGHGWRTVGSTWARDHGYSDDAVELQLAHVEGSDTKAAYNRAQHLELRRRMLQAWADWLGGAAVAR